LSKSVHILASISFGKYLGVPLATHKPKVGDYEELLLKFNKRLVVWQTKFINFAGRVTLIKSILSFVPVYHMQATALSLKLLQGWNNP